MDISAAELLQAWEDGASLHPVRKALLLLNTAWPEIALTTFGETSIGERDAYLLTLRQALFGPTFTGVGSCPACGEPIELSFRVEDIRALPPPHESDALEIALDSCRVWFRLPSSLDLLAVASHRSVDDARRALLLRCVLDVESEEGRGAHELPEPVERALVEQMEQADPQANVQLALDCPGCGHHWLQSFDVFPYLWQEIDDWAMRTLNEVHLLASAYGRSERAILDMTARRRGLYREMVI
jgi:hypothetical protein